MPDELSDVQRGQWFERGYNKGKADLASDLGITLDAHGKAVVPPQLIQCPCGEVWALDTNEERWCAKCGINWSVTA